MLTTRMDVFTTVNMSFFSMHYICFVCSVSSVDRETKMHKVYNAEDNRG